MSRTGRKSQRRKGTLPSPNASEGARKRDRALPTRPNGKRTGRSRPTPKRRVVKFVLLLAGMMVIFNALFYVFGPLDWVKTYLALNAEISGAVLRVFGEDAAVVGTSVGSPRFSLDIQRGCDALQVSAFFVFAVLAFPAPVPRWRRVPALAVGVGLLSVINLVRIVSLFYTGIYFPGAFEAMHVAVWQPAFIALGLLFWMTWIWSATRPVAGVVRGRA